MLVIFNEYLHFHFSRPIPTNAEDIDAIFKYDLPKALKAAKKQGRELPIVFYAHGGLVPERTATRQAVEHIRWWKRNNVYPIYFIWETGFLETILQLGGISRELQARGDARSFIPDPIIELIARNAGGRLIWAAMKESARLACVENGGAFKVVQHLNSFYNDKKNTGVRLHAVGHSAGAIFHSHFVPAVIESLNSSDSPGFQSLQLLAPALTVKDFQDTLAKYMGKAGGIDGTTIFSLLRETELKDNSAYPYGKSLLYLVYNALEAESQTPLLGLWESLNADPELQKLFGLRGKPAKHGAVIWCPTENTDAKRSASGAEEHGDFDSDAPTMGSILRRIQRKGDKDGIDEFPAGMKDRNLSNGDRFFQFDWPDEVLDWFAPGRTQAGVSPYFAPMQSYSSGGVSQSNGISHHTGSQSRRRALCVGINAYQSSPLNGCVADAHLWAQTLTGLGFEIQKLLDEQATFDGILGTLRRMIEESREGDVLVFQYAGHGTQLPDVNGDEIGEDTSADDEAICPYDYASGRFVLDDDIADVFSLLKSTRRGVSMTCFIDCCHSGTISRFGVGVVAGQRSLSANEHIRFLTPSKEMIENHRLFRRRGGKGRSLIPRGPDDMREIVFSACLSNEKAFESNQQGDFTRHATAVLGQYGIDLTNEEFERRVRDAFGTQGRQHPNLDCAFANRQNRLLEPLAILS